MAPKDPEILPYPLCLRNIWREWSVDDMKKTGLNRYVYGFNVDHDAIAVDDILDIYMYLMKKNNMIGIGTLELVLVLLTNTWITGT